MDDITIVFYSRNREGALQRALDSLRDVTPHPMPPVMVLLDDHRRNNVYEIFEMLRPEDHLIDLPIKSSCAHLWNLGITLSATRYVMLCNDDMVFHAGYYEKLKKLIAQGFEYIMLMNHGAFVLDKSVVPILGYADERFTDGWYEDNDYRIRCHQRGIRATCINHLKLVTHERTELGSGWLSYADNERFFMAKWQVPAEMHGGTEEDLEKHKQRIADIDWYPHYTQYCRYKWPHV